MVFGRSVRSWRIPVGLAGLAVAVTACSSSGSSTASSSASSPAAPAPAATSAAAPAPSAPASAAASSAPAGSTAVSGPSIKLKLEDYQSTTDPLTIALQAYAKQVSTDTQGLISITVYPNSQLVTQTNDVSSLTSDAADIGIGGDDQFATLIPGVSIASQPGFVTSWDAAQKIQASPQVLSFLSDQYTAKGLHLFAVIPDGFSYLITQNAINTPADLKGVKVRVPGTASAGIISALGGTPVTLALGDVFEGLEVHTVNGALTTATSFDSFHLYQVAKYVDTIPLNMSWFHFAMNKGVWDKMSPSEQAVMTKDSQDMAVTAGKGEEANASKALADLKTAGATIVTPPDLTIFSDPLKSLQQTAINASATGKQLAALETTAMGG